MNQRPEPAPGILYVVGTPIGNLGDLSPRARSVLQKVSLIACEDTRHSGKMLKLIRAEGIRISFHQHNIQRRLPHLLIQLSEGKSIALISDAGLPGVSDPGENLVAAAKERGHEVICIPGPCAATTALVSSGLPSSSFCFEGFLPIKGVERKKRLKEISQENRTSIIYESPHRLIKLLKELLEVCGHNRPLQISRELTKLHEQQIGPNISSALKHFIKEKPQGEFTLVLGGAPLKKDLEKGDSFYREELRSLIKAGASSNEAARKLAKTTGKSKRELYSLIHQKEEIDNI